MEAAVVSLQGDELFWYQWEEQEGEISCWSELKYSLLRRFRPHNQGGLVEQWLSVKQRGTAADYCREFIEKLTSLGKVPLEISLGVFLHGLKEYISCEVRLMDPSSLKMAMEWAEKIEEKNWAKFRYGRARENQYFGPNNLNPYPKPYPQPTNFPQNPKPVSSYNPNPNSNTNPYFLPKPKGDRGRMLSEKEMRKRRSKGLCFKCDESWSLSHVCKN